MIRATVLGALLAVLAAVPALACRCVEPDPPRAFGLADGAALVTVDRVSEDGHAVTIAARVLRAWGAPVGEGVTLVTDTTTCGAVFLPTRTYLVFLYPAGDAWGTSRCVGNREEAEAGPARRWLDANARRTR